MKTAKELLERHALRRASFQAGIPTRIAETQTEFTQRSIRRIEKAIEEHFHPGFQLEIQVCPSSGIIPESVISEVTKWFERYGFSVRPSLNPEASLPVVWLASELEPSGPLTQIWRYRS